MGNNVLVVDDSSTVRQQVRTALVNAGFNALEAEDGKEGLRVLEGSNVDCVICDVNMPRMNGIEMVQELHSNPSLNQPPVVMLTTEGAQDLINKAREAGACGWIVKPFQPDLLIAAVRKLTAS